MGSLPILLLLLAFAGCLRGAEAQATDKCTAPANAIELTAPFKAEYVWNANGVENYTCSKGNWTLLGYLVNLTDSKTGQHTRYGFTERWADGSFHPRFVATDAANRTVTGTLRTDRAVSVDQPAPSPNDIFWFRRSASDQTGIFAQPAKVLYVSRTNTKGGIPPPGACKEGELVVVPNYSATYTFYTCGA